VKVLCLQYNINTSARSMFNAPDTEVTASGSISEGIASGAFWLFTSSALLVIHFPPAKQSRDSV
jgi:hypothetical protein